ncbi:Carbohydrate-binding WSC [Metarhizium rileyi]|uniref:Carbohydrate-binding WSC n=1 Tax=Metarhizium rileyi (strain RCEF 4871) TaxID=1649241 RepID=A0A167IVB2_METRR|nr:Carbohydrate-binding WSC [Metarhizium rileyi RCEF 4871]
MALRVVLATAMALAGLVSGLGDTDTITWGGDNSRAGYQTNHNMDPSIVGSSQFGQLFRTALPGVWVGQPEQIFSQPLVYTPNGSDKQFVYFATTQNNVYKLDAKTGQIVASRNLHIPFLTADLDGCVDINPTIGITATGVIDPATDTLYLTAKTYVDQTGGEKAQGLPAGRYYIHALDVNDFSERPNFPVNLEGIIASNTPERMFQGGIHHQRPGLLHTGDFIYAGFASHCVQYNFTGWVIGWHKTSGKIVEKWSTEGQGVPNTIRGGGIWMSGGGIASDDKGSIFLATGNGYASQLADVPVNGFNPPTSLEEAALHMTINADGSLRLVDFFMPWEKRALDGADKDLGTSPLEILPSEFSCGAVKRIGVVTGKSGKTYFLNLDNLGGYKNGKDGLDDVIQVYENLNSVYAGAGVYPLEGGYIYINVIQHPSIVFKFSCNNGSPSFSKVAETPINNAYILGVSHGTTTSLNGQPGTGLLWITDVQGLNLRVYDAVPQGQTMNLIQSFNIPGVTKFTRPVFGNGIVYVGTAQGYVYGFGSPINVPLNCTSPVDFGGVNMKNSSAAKPVTCKALVGVTVTGIELNDAKNHDFSLSGLPNLPLQLAVDQTFSVNAQFSPSKVGLQSNDIVVNTTNSAAGFSTGTHARLTGTGKSADPLLDVTPVILTFKKAVTGQDPTGVSESIIASNLGNGLLTVQSVLYSTTSTDGPFKVWNGQGDLVVGKFRLQKLPITIAPNSVVTVNIQFDTSERGTYSCYIKFVSDGGNKTVSMAASAGPPPKALLEFQTPDEKGWVKYESGKPFTFGNVTENTSRSLKFRVTNSAPAGAVPLSLTVSKPPFGVAGLVRALNQVDLAEGTSLGAGESANATLICNVPYAQWNTAPYNGTAQWTMNTNDPTFEKQFVQFFCNAVSEQASPLLPNGLSQFKYVGCYRDNTPGRQLPNQILAADTMTNADCIRACNSKGYIFCATQYHRECWAGNSIPLQKVDDVNCNFYCMGAMKQICGGSGSHNDGAYMSLFGDVLKWDGNHTKPSLPSGPVINPGVSGYVSIGCYTEATDGRALTSGVSVDKEAVKNCVNACKAGNYIYAGVEYGGECWCGNKLTAGSVPAPDKDCSMTCNDNSTEYCGGPSRLNVYKLNTGDTTTTKTTTAASITVSTSSVSTTASNTTTSSTSTTSSSSETSKVTTTSSTPTPTGPVKKARIGNWIFQGCWTEASNGRALTSLMYADDKMTLESCAKFCDGLAYFGVEYGRECYCGNTLKAGSIKADDQHDCKFLCPGDKTEYCGAGLRLELYKYDTSSSSSSVPSSTITSTSTSVKNGSPITTTTTTTITSEVSTSSPNLQLPTHTSTSTTSSLTTSYDTSSTVSSSTKTSTTSTTPTPTGPVISDGNANFTFYACVSEPSNGRLLKSQVLNAKNMTIEMCLGNCNKYRYAGVEYGQECWCGDELNLASGGGNSKPGKNVTNTECNFLCPGNHTEYCGAGMRLSLYSHRNIAKRLDWSIL